MGKVSTSSHPTALLPRAFQPLSWRGRGWIRGLWGVELNPWLGWEVE